MKYPSNNKIYSNNNINYKNRGMFLESIINDTNKFYIEKDIAYIYKKPTPIGIIKVIGKKITEGYFKEASTLDFVGLYQGKYIEFDAKETKSKTSFPLKNIHLHQIKHMKNVYRHGGYSFIILFMNDKYFFLNITYINNFIKNNERKSIPYEDIIKNCPEINYNYLRGIDYIKIIKKIMEDEINEIKKT